MTLPTDLKGVSHLEYKELDDDNPAVSVLAPAAQQIEEHIQKYGPRKPAVSRRYSPVLERGSVSAGLADAVLYYSKKRHGYTDEVRQLILDNKVIPSMYYYVTEEGAGFWLTMSSDARYQFKNHSTRLLRRDASKIASAVLGNTPDQNAIDLISLGSGDGTKDRVLLSGFKESGSSSITYYPLDISDKLMVECVRHVHGDTLEFTGVRTKAVIGDFMELQLLRSVYEDRETPNLFSVLGNTFGNTDEAKIMTALQDSMYPGDFVLIEINCDLDEVEAAASFLREDVTLRYSCVPIEMLGVKVDLNMAKVREVDDLSVFQCAKSSATYYKEVKINGRTVKEAPLAYDHRYPLEEFKSELADYLQADILLAERYGKAALILAQKQPRVPS